MSHNGIYDSEEEVLAAVREELADPAYGERKHHDIKTYNMGCRGPLCRKRSRDYGRAYYRQANNVPDTEIHRPTVRTRWDGLLEQQLREMVSVA